jgi:putative ABC transport system substrate-binding protein
MNRREVFTLLGAAGAAWPVGAWGQRAERPVLAHIHAGTLEGNRDEVAAFEEGLKQGGYINGQNVLVEYHWAEGRYERLTSMVAELSSRPLAIVVAGTPVAAIAVKRIITSIPVLFHIGSDPVKDGLVASLNRPGGNVTGSTFFSNLLTSKRLALLREMIPTAMSIVALVNPKNANAQFQMDEAKDAARALGLQLRFVKATNQEEIDATFKELSASPKPDALIILSDSFLNSRAAQIAYSALRAGLPTCFAYREPALAGGLIGYGASRTENARQVGVYAARILKGEKPADLPVLQPTRFEFVINLRTARALGITVPATLLARADEVIE